MENTFLGGTEIGGFVGNSGILAKDISFNIILGKKIDLASSGSGGNGSRLLVAIFSPETVELFPHVHCTVLCVHTSGGFLFKR